VRPVLRRPRRAGTSTVAGGETGRSHPAGYISSIMGRGVALFWLLDGQAEEGGGRDELACPARGQTNIGGQRMTEAAAEASESASVSGARTGDALAGGIACLAVFCVAEGARSGAEKQT
jgi:hypothetical protein